MMKLVENFKQSNEKWWRLKSHQHCITRQPSKWSGSNLGGEKINKGQKTQLVKLTNYERFHDQAICKNGNLIEEAMVVRCELTNLNQALKDENLQEAMKE